MLILILRYFLKPIAVRFHLIDVLGVSCKVASNLAERQEEIKFRVMRLPAKISEISKRQIAEAVGMSNAKAHYSVSAVIGEGHVKVKSYSNSEMKTAYLCQFTLHGIREKALLKTKFLERKLEQFEDLKAEIARLEEKFGESQECQHG